MLVLDIRILKVRDACLITKVTSFFKFFYLVLTEARERKEMQACDGLDVKESLKFGRHVTYRCLSTGLFWAIKRIIFKPDAQINQNTMQCCGMEVIFGCVICFPVLPEIKFFFFPQIVTNLLLAVVVTLYTHLFRCGFYVQCVSLALVPFCLHTWGVCVCVCVHVCTCVSEWVCEPHECTV